jgi:hypothetical protein
MLELAQHRLAELVQIAKIVLFPRLEIPEEDPDVRRLAVHLPLLGPYADQEGAGGMVP